MVFEVRRRNFLQLAGLQVLAGAIPLAEVHASPIISSTAQISPKTRLRGSNIVCTANPMGQPWSRFGTTVWAAMWSVWDWDNWIRPQIDDAAAVGNSVRLWGSTQCFLAGDVTEDTYFTRWQQLLDYCAGKGLYMVATGSDLQSSFEHTLNSDQAAAHYSTWASMLSGYSGVVGVDLMNEAWVNHDSYDWVQPILRACADAVHGQDLPVTVSFPVFDSNLWSWNAAPGAPMASMYQQNPVKPFFELCDYLDFHIYAFTQPDQVAATFDNDWAAGKPMMFGEFGISADQSPQAQMAFYDMVKRLVTASPANLGALAWSCYDVNTAGNKYGLYSAPGILRSASAMPFATFPTTR